MRAALVIAARDLRSRLRDRSALVTAFVAPLALALILGIALGDDGGGFETTLAVADLDGGEVAETFVVELLGGQALGEAVTVHRVESADEVREAVRAGDARAGIVLPEGLTATVAEGAAVAAPASAAAAVTIEVVRSDDAPVSGDLAEGLAQGLVARLDVGRQAGAMATAAQADGETVARVVEQAGRAPPALALERAAVDGVRSSAADYFGPAMGVFFVYFVVGLGPRGLLLQRRQGNLARLATAPIPLWAPLAGTALSVLLLAFASLAVLWAATTLVFGAHWGAPSGVLALVVGIVLAAAAITALIATLARTDEQVTGWTSIVVFTFALLGGSFGQLPPALEGLSLLTPNGWALRGFVDLSSGGGLDVVALPLAAMVAFALVAVALTAPRIDRLMRP